ncbi:rhodanese-like domain-containing protein [Arthrobacter sp. UYEF3]|uniref:rhodanese-like domain-containing protein n=1 Tax=Arthrobacter sp. UYEF3 TaxID=1756365 RepID=UPI00339462BD
MGLISSLKKALGKPYKTVLVAEAKELISSGATLIDVRTVAEWRSGRALQPKHVPLVRLQSSTAGIQKIRTVVATEHHVCLLCGPAEPGGQAARRPGGQDPHRVRL